MTITHGAAAATEQTRARYPDRRGLHRARRRADLLRGLRRGRARRSCSCPPGRSSTRASGRCRSHTWRGGSAWSSSTGAATGSRIGPRSPRRTPRPSSLPTPLAVMEATGTEHAVVASLSRGAERSLHLAAAHPERVDGIAFIAPALPLGSSVRARERPRCSTSRARATRAGRSGTATTGSRATRTSSSSSSRRRSPSRIPRSSARMRSAGGARRTPRRSSPLSSHRGSRMPSRCAS